MTAEQPELSLHEKYIGTLMYIDGLVGDIEGLLDAYKNTPAPKQKAIHRYERMLSQAKLIQHNYGCMLIECRIIDKQNQENVVSDIHTVQG
jgi:hypothetical protein